MESNIVRNEVKQHDFFNIVVLLFICSLNIYFLSLTTDISLLGTDELASEPYHRFLFKFSLYLFIAYVVFDTFWVILIPSCVLSNPMSILFHHLVTLVMTLVPFVHQQFGWHFGACILVEVNTFFLTLRRNLSRGTVAYAIRYFKFYLINNASTQDSLKQHYIHFDSATYFFTCLGWFSVSFCSLG
jgi:hypothetical protein